MRWSIIRLIWFRELRDQLRDRRTVFMVAVLPVLIYPLLGLGVLRLAVGFKRPDGVVGIYGSDHLPQPTALSAGTTPLPAVAWLSLTPSPAGNGPDRAAAAVALAQLAEGGLGQEPPPLLALQGDTGHFLPAYFDTPDEAETLSVRALPWPADLPRQPEPGGEEAWLRDAAGGPLQQREVGLLLVVPPEFDTVLQRGGRPEVYLLQRDDELSHRLAQRVQTVLGKWKARIKTVRLLNRGLPPDFDDPFHVDDPEQARPLKQAVQGLQESLSHLFPFLLVLWSLTGALYPAVDLCAGEKERGTMETLLISPASREEIVYGKFLTIWVFSGTTALLNLASMGVTTALFSGRLSVVIVQPAALFWCVLLCLPLSAFFSAVCLAVGAYARSSKEGQYYLMPLFLVTMPLIFLTLAPGVELNAFYSMVPVTGVALLLQRLMSAPTLDQVPWGYFVPVLGPTVLYGWLALRWAVWQFQREEVLFREAERLDVRLWLRHLFREKEPLPSTGQALFCFALIMGLRWLALGAGARLPLLAQAAVDLVAFVVTPPLFMAVLLTTRPLQALALRLPPRQALVTAVLLVFLLVLPLTELTRYSLEQFPELKRVLLENDSLARLKEGVQATGTSAGSWWQLALVLVLLAPVCEELAFRGFVLVGLRRRFSPWTAILLSSFLYAVAHLNVFQFVPTFILGVILGLIATRSRSVLPGMLLQVVYNGLLILPLLVPEVAALEARLSAWPVLRAVLVAGCSLLATSYLIVNGYRLWLSGRSPWWDEVPVSKPSA